MTSFPCPFGTISGYRIYPVHLYSECGSGNRCCVECVIFLSLSGQHFFKYTSGLLMSYVYLNNDIKHQSSRFFENLIIITTWYTKMMLGDSDDDYRRCADLT